MMKSFQEIKKNLKSDFSGKTPLKLGILGDSATQFYVQALRGLGFDYDFDFRIFEADFNQIDRQVYDLQSEFYAFDPDIVILFHSTHKLLGKYNKLTAEQQSGLCEQRMQEVRQLTDMISSNLKAKIIYLNYPEIDDAVYGSFANKMESSFLFQLRKLNYELMSFAAASTNFFICDVASVQNLIGKRTLFQPAIYVNTEFVFSLDAIPMVAQRTVDIIAAAYGRFKKCVIVDLDNTLWGGVIGDDGIEKIQLGSLGIGKAFTEFQYWLKKLKNRGIILAVCSKNEENVAKEPFEKHPDMVLRLEDIAVFTANWENKADNIRTIQSVLNIGFDSMVFLDDNPFERNMVRDNIPGICVPELPEDPTEYLEYLYSLNLFETISFSSEDKERTNQYRVESQRLTFHRQCTDEADFLSGLEMVSQVEGFNKFNTPRVAQLSQRSNQFNLRTVRYTEADIEQLALADDYATFAFTLEDRFGEHGLICVVVLRKADPGVLFVENWFMSCRVLKRGMEDFVLNTLVEYAKATDGITTLRSEYIPTPKNGIVKDHYAGLGFTPTAEDQGRISYELDVTSYQTHPCFIKAKQ
ncbi:MAG: HAD-IIIC family phosphatase [Dysgonamonadaceae bacterium]|jgi:FkbH-like protein|nr:HAD-IIIC family phosphatase [Dysgonamonadaceae bacterium]